MFLRLSLTMSILLSTLLNLVKYILVPYSSISLHTIILTKNSLFLSEIWEMVADSSVRGNSRIANFFVVISNEWYTNKHDTIAHHNKLT